MSGRQVAESTRMCVMIKRSEPKRRQKDETYGIHVGDFRGSRIY